MGVKGLGSFLKDNRGSLCRTLQLPPTTSSAGESQGESAGDAKGETVKVVVDAWSILFPLYLSSLPWQSGGEYLRYYKLICRLIEAWRGVGLEPIFVFDGASPPEKHATLLNRLHEQINTSRLFYTTSASSRSAASFSRHQILLPPLAYHTLVHALHNLGVRSHHVAIGEADGFVVSLAETLGAYILSQDSDYLVLISNAGLTRVRGYCPLDMVGWIPTEGVSSSASADIEGQGDASATENGDDGPGDEASGANKGAGGEGEGAEGGWEIAHSRRPDTYTPRQSHLLPPPLLSHPTLLLTFIPPTALRARLRLPPSMMPLLASLCGNDYTPPQLPEMLFESSLKASGRIEKVARVIRETVFGPSGSGSPRTNGSSGSGAGDAAVTLVRKLIEKLAVRDFTHAGALQALVEGVIEATFQYTLPLDHTCCDLYPFCGELEAGCGTRPPSRASSSVPTATASASGALPGGAAAIYTAEAEDTTAGESLEIQGKRAYAAAAKQGYGGSMAHLWAYPGRMYLWNVLEDPNGASPKAGEGARRMRAAAWGYAEEALGGLCWPSPLPASLPEDPDASSTRETREAVGDDDDGTAEASALSSMSDDPAIDAAPPALPIDLADPPTAALPAPPPAREILEYVRSSNRIVPLPNPLPPLSDRPIPAALLPLSDRLAFYLSALSSDLRSIHSLPPHLQSLVALLRFTIITAERRGPASQWRRPEVVGFLRAALGTFAKWDSLWSRPESATQAEPITGYREHQAALYPLLTNRNATLLAAFAATMTDSIYLAQALLLHPDPISTEPAGTLSSTSEGTGPKSKKARTTRLPHLIPFVWFNGTTLHAILGGREIGKETGVWRWEEREAREFDLCWAALAAEGDMGEYVTGWDGPAVTRPLGLGMGNANRNVEVPGGRDDWRAPLAREREREREGKKPDTFAFVDAPLHPGAGGGSERRTYGSGRPSAGGPRGGGAGGGGGGGVKAMLERGRYEDRRKTSSSGRFDLLGSLGGAS